MVGLGFSVSSSRKAAGTEEELGLLLLLLGAFEPCFTTVRDRPLPVVVVPPGFPGAKMATCEVDGGPRLFAATLPWPLLVPEPPFVLLTDRRLGLDGMGAVKFDWSPPLVF